MSSLTKKSSIKKYKKTKMGNFKIHKYIYKMGFKLKMTNFKNPFIISW